MRTTRCPIARAPNLDPPSVDDDRQLDGLAAEFRSERPGALLVPLVGLVGAGQEIADVVIDERAEDDDRVTRRDLLQVVLDGLLATQSDVVLVYAERFRCTPPAEEVPVAVELDLDVGKPIPVRLAGLAARLELPEPVLFGDELF